MLGYFMIPTSTFIIASPADHPFDGVLFVLAPAPEAEPEARTKDGRGLAETLTGHLVVRRRWQKRGRPATDAMEQSVGFWQVVGL